MVYFDNRSEQKYAGVSKQYLLPIDSLCLSVKTFYTGVTLASHIGKGF